jgi:hypothetical protein
MTRHGADTLEKDFRPDSFHIKESKSPIDLQKEQIILMLMNYGGVNKHEVKAGETWNYHFDKNCTVLLVFEDDQ